MKTTKRRILSILICSVLLCIFTCITVYALELNDSTIYYSSSGEEELMPLTANGCYSHTVYTSKNLYGYDVSMDVEQGGSGLVNIHVHCDGVKYTYNFSSGTYISANGNTLPSKVANSSEIGSAFNKAMYYYNAWS